MIEVSIVLFSLLVEGFFALLIVISVYIFLLKKRKNNDREAINKLVEQIKVQSEIRMKKTGSFLSEKYNLEGNELEKTVKVIDKAEKKFLQKLINVYRKRDTHGLIVMDANVAELIETYKELTPVMPEAEAHIDINSGDSEQTEAVQQEIADLQEQNKSLAEELSITKETMGNMIAEFGNMFGGGKEHEIENKEVIEKYKETSGNTEEIAHVDTSDADLAPAPAAIEQDEEVDDIQLDDADSNSNELAVEELADHEDSWESTLEVEHLEVDQRDEANQSDEVKKEEEVKTKDVPGESFDEGIDDLIDGIDLSDESL